MNLISLIRLSLITLVILVHTCLAQADDSTQLVYITSKQASLDFMQHTANYNGNVSASQGSRIIRGTKLTLYADQNNQLKKIITQGSPAFSQVHTQQADIAQGQALQIIYIPYEHLIQYREQAELNEGGNIFKGPLINYNILTKIVHSPLNPKEQTTIIIPPYNQIKRNP